MAARFGGKDEDAGSDAGQDDVALLDTELDRLGALSLPRLAGEVMTKGFGPDGPGGPDKPGSIENPTSDERLRLNEIARAVTPAYAGKGVSQEQQLRLGYLCGEAMQVLENAALVRVTWRGGAEDYCATRRGRQALERGELEQILAATGL